MVTRCICADISFATLIDLCRGRDDGWAWARASLRVASGCGMCEPYAREALRSGRSSVPVIECADALTRAPARETLRAPRTATRACAEQPSC